jgi:hypothetical protein
MSCPLHEQQQHLIPRSGNGKRRDGDVSVVPNRAEIERRVAEARAQMLQARLEAEQARKQAEIRNPLLRVPPPQTRYKDHVTGKLHDWPRRADGLPLSGAQVASKIRRERDYIWRARALGMQALQQMHWQSRDQPHALHSKHSMHTVGLRMCVDVSTPVRLRVCCSMVARVADGLGAAAGKRSLSRHARDWATCIAEHVHGCYCRRIKVRRGVV